MKKVNDYFACYHHCSRSKRTESNGEKTFRIEDFNAIRCEFVADIYYTQGKSYSVEAQASEKIMNMVSIHKKVIPSSLPKRKVTRKVTRTKRDYNSTSQPLKSMICKYPAWQISMPKKWMWKTLA